MKHRFEIRFPFFLFLFLLLALFFDSTGIIRCSLLAVLLHETGHGAAYLFLLHYWPDFCVSPGGIRLCWPQFGYRRADEILILLAGPAANLLTAGICFALAQAQARFFLYFFGGVNFLLAVFNLIPMGFLDGGKLLDSFFGLRFPRTTQFVKRLFQALSLLLGLALLFGSSAGGASKIAVLLFIFYFYGQSLVRKV